MKQNLKKGCSLVLAVLLMINTSSLQAFADVMTTDNSAEIVAEQTADISAAETGKTTETAAEMQESEIEIGEEPETVGTNGGASTEEPEAVLPAEEINATEAVIATEESEVTEELETIEGIVVTEETETTEESEAAEEPKTTEESEVTEEPETTEESEVTEEPETTEETEEPEEPEAAEGVNAVNADELMVSLKIEDFTGTAERKTILTDVSINPFVMETSAVIKMEVSIKDRDNKDIAYNKLTDEQKKVVEDTISSYLANINMAVTLSNETTTMLIIDESRGTDLASVFKNQYIPVDGTQEEIAAKEQEAAEALSAFVKTVADKKQHEMLLVNEMNVCADKYKLQGLLTTSDNAAGVTLNAAEGEVEFNVEKIASSIDVTTEAQTETVDISDKIVYNINVSDSEELTGRNLLCVATKEDGTIAEETEIAIEVSADKKMVTVTPKVSGTYTLEFTVEENAVYEKFSSTKTLTVRKPEWAINVEREDDKPLTAMKSANYIVSVKGENLKKEELSCIVYEKINGNYVKCGGELAKVIGTTKDGAKKVQFTPDKAVEYKIEFKLAGNASYRETVKTEEVLPAKIERPLSVSRNASGIATMGMTETFVVSESNRNLDKSELTCKVYKVAEDESKEELSAEAYDITVKNGSWSDRGKVKIEITPKVIGCLEIEFTVGGNKELYQDTTISQTLTVKTDWPVTVTSNTPGNNIVDAAAPIVYSIDVEEGVERNYELEFKAYYEEKTWYGYSYWTECETGTVVFSENEDKTAVTVIPKMSGKLKFDFIFKNGEKTSYYYEVTKTTNEIEVKKISSVSTILKEDDDSVNEAPALSEVVYSVKDNGAIEEQKITSCSVKIDGKNVTKEDAYVEISDDKRTVKVTPYISGKYELEFTLGENAVYHEAVISKELTVNKISQPEEIAVTLKNSLGENEAITPEKELTYVIQDTSAAACDISMRNIIWRVTDKEDKVVFTNVAAADGDATKLNPEAFIIKEVASEDKTVRKVSVIPQVSGDYTIEFELAEDAAYLPVSKTTDISVKPSDLTGFVSASGDYVKTNPLVVSMTLNAGNSKLFEECYNDIEVTFYAAYSNGEEIKEIELKASTEKNAKNGWELSSQDENYTATYTRTVDFNITRDLDPEKNYSIIARFELPENFAYQVKDSSGNVVNELVYENFKASNADLLVTLSDASGPIGENENENYVYNLEYTEDENAYKTISIFAEEKKDVPDGKNLIDGKDVGYKINGDYNGIVEIIQSTSSIQIRAVKPMIMNSKISIVIDDVCGEVCEENCSKCGIYNGKTVELTINITSPASTDTKIDYNGTHIYKNVEEFGNKAAAQIENKGKKEYWYDKTVKVSADYNFYNYVAYIEMNEVLEVDVLDNATGWKFVPTSWIIDKEESTNYAFYFFHLPEDGSIEGKTSARIREEFFNTRQADGKYKILESIGIDMTAPTVEKELFAATAPSKYSTPKASYFPQAVTVSAYAENGTEEADINTKNRLDGQSGIKKVEYYNPETGKWEEIKDVARYATNCAYTTSQSGGEVTFKFTDNVDRTTTVSYRGSYLNGTEPVYEKESPAKTTLCVDTVKPKVEIAKITVGSDGKEYEGEWTNETITYILKTIKKDQQVSGINNYQYVFVPRSEAFNPDTADWQVITKNKKSGRYEIDIVELLQTKEKDRVRFNGYLYVRAESNAGLMSTDKSIEKNKAEARIWQEKLDKPKVTLSNEPATTGWYNQETGEVKVSFAYPEYDDKNYAPPVGLEIKVSTTTTEQDGSNKTTEKEVKYFYQGIFDEAAAEVIEGEAAIDGDNIKVNTKKKLKKSGSITVNSDCKKVIEVTVLDKAGNKSETYKCTIKADFTAPDVKNVIFTAGSQTCTQNELHTEEEIKKAEAENKDPNDIVTYNLFSGADITVNAAVTYGISGESKITLQQCKEVGEWNGKDKKDSNIVKSNTMTLQPNTRGFVYVTAKDKAGNVTTRWTDGFVTDNQNPMGEDGMEITVLATGANEELFFNKDVPVYIGITDSKTGDDYSGLSKVTYTLGYEDVTTKEEKQIYYFEIENPIWKQIAKSIGFATNEIVINAEENESNEAYITVNAIDKAKNESTITMEYKIDVTVPIIDVTFDKAPDEHGNYFNQSRTATIEITEKNFDPSRVKVTILKDEKEIGELAPDTSAWKDSADGLVHTASIVFAEDGDYSFTVECTDRADNEAEIVEVEEFTIDKTAPEVTVTYDNEEPWKENFYNTVRTATVTITEHNFDEDKFIADITPAVAVGSFKSHEDTHTATIVFAEDEHYDFTLNCEDKAGNAMTAYEAEDFVIDTTAPEVRITGVEDLSANAGDIAPVIYASDKNFDEEGMSITLTNSKGSQISVEKVVTAEEEGTSYTLTNVNAQPDEIYTLTAEITDMAGNVSNVSYRFSLNRNGSTYDLSDMITLVEQVYTRYAEMEDLQVLEMNVDSIEEFGVYVSKNGVLQTNSMEGALPKNLEENTVYYRTDMEGNAETGYRYYYTLYKENFEAEGVYDIMFYSKDRAGNEVNNTLTEKGADITFVVDNSAPKALIEGIETDAFYAEDSKDVNVTVNDNFKLEEAFFYLTDEDGKTIQTYDYMELAKEAGDVVTLKLPNNDKKMSITYRAVDAAGNDVFSLSGDEDVPKGFTISTNVWLQFINNEVAVAVTVIVGGIAIAAPVGGRMLYRRRKKTGAKLWKRN